MLNQPLMSRLAMLARVCGRTLLLVFLVSVFFAVFPLNLGSPLWGSQLSSRIIDSASIALVGITLLGGAAVVEQSPEDLERAPRRGARRGSPRASVMRLCRLGMISLALLALWQLPLLLGNTVQINQRSLSQSARTSPAMANAEQFLRQASAAELETAWQRLIASGAPALKRPVSGSEQKRQILLAAIKADQRQIERRRRIQVDKARLALMLDSLRRIALCGIYGGGFFLLRRSLGGRAGYNAGPTERPT